MATDGQLKFRADENLRGRVSSYVDEYGHDNRSEALRELVEVGLREQRSPILWRAKNRVVEWVNLMALAAVLVFALGTTTSLLSFVDGVIAALYILLLATALLASYEVARAAAGANGLGTELRAAIATVVNR
jgi:hypothetical protein